MDPAACYSAQCNSAMPNKARASHDVVALTVLALLCEGPHHPYAIQRLIAERHKDFALGKTRAMYHGVERLLRDGLIEAVETTREGRRPERTVYQITDDGREELEAWVADLVGGHQVVEYPSYVVALSFLPVLSKNASIQALSSRLVMLEATIAGLEASMKVLTEQMGLPRAVLLEHEYTLAAKRAELEWTRGLIAEIEADRVRWDSKWLHEQFEEVRGGRKHG